MPCQLMWLTVVWKNDFNSFFSPNVNNWQIRLLGIEIAVIFQQNEVWPAKFDQLKALQNVDPKIFWPKTPRIALNWPISWKSIENQTIPMWILCWNSYPMCASNSDIHWMLHQFSFIEKSSIETQHLRRNIWDAFVFFIRSNQSLNCQTTNIEYWDISEIAIPKLFDV